MDPDPALAVRTIVLPLDGLASSERVFPFAARLASAFRARLVLLRALGNVNPALSHDADALALALASHKEAHRAARAKLSENAAELRARHLEVQIVLEDGDAAVAIHRTSDAVHADMIAMVSRPRGMVASVLLGSVADRVVQQVKVPILLVPYMAPHERWAEGRGVDVLVTLDGSKFAEAALRPALGLAGALGGSLLLLRVANAHERAAAETYLTEVARDPAGSGPSIDRQVAVAPSASSAILETVHARHIGVLAMATHGRGGFLRAVLGSVAGETVALTDIPVLLVRPQHSIQ